jgi:hypothetical protein
MKEHSRGAAWRLSVDPLRGVLRMAFEGRLSLSEARSSAAACAELLAKGPHDVVWDLRLMQGYDVLAPIVWQRALRPWIGNVRSLGVVGGNSFVRLGATALASALGIAVSKDISDEA